MNTVPSIIWLWLFVLCFFSGTTTAAPLILDNTTGKLETHEDFLHFKDSSQQLTIEDISKSEFSTKFSTPSHHPFNFGRNQAAHWIKFDVKNQSDITWYLVINSVILAENKLYIFSNDRTSPLQGRKYFTQVRQRLPTYRLNLDKTTTYTIYLCLTNKGKGMLFAPIQLIDADELQKKTSKEVLFFGCMMMGIIAMAIYNLFLFIRLKDINYLTLSLTQIAITLILQRVNNVLPLPISISNPEGPLFYLVFFFFMATSIILMRSLLNTQKYDPLVDKFLYFLLIFVFLLAPFLSFIPRADLLSFATGLVIAISALTLMLKKQLEGDAVVKAFFIAASIFIAGSLPLVAWGLNLTGSFNFASYIFHISTFFTSIMMSLALAEKTRQMKQQTDQARAANKAKTEFLTTMSHELRTPMHAVIGVGALMKLTTLSNQQKKYIEKLDTSSRHMMSIIERVLDLSRLENNKVTLETKPFRLKEILERVEKLLSDQAQQKGLSLYMQSDFSVTQQLEGDPTRLSQVLLNLLGNSIKFTDKGYVSLIITPLQVEQSHHVTLTFEVKDTGIGLSSKQQEMLFKPFSQVDSSRTRKRGGFGLGLAISHKLVSNMGGYLDVDSSPGVGSRFFFTLSFTELNSEEKLVDPVNPGHSLSGLRILLVDDDEINRFLGLELLQALEAEVSIADSGKVALELVEKHHYDLILIDISMPEMDGYQTTQHIRKNGHNELPIIALTAHAIAGERDRCLQAGMNDYLTKPFETIDLLTMIRFWTNQTNHSQT
ncbi:MAG: response regulator [Thiolinea sp.]